MPGDDARHVLNRAERRAEAQANMIVVTIVVVANAGANSSREARALERAGLPSSRCQIGDSGRNGRMTISGIAGIRPEISV